MRLIIDMHPLDTACARRLERGLNQAHPKFVPLIIWMHGGIQNGNDLRVKLTFSPEYPARHVIARHAAVLYPMTERRAEWQADSGRWRQ